MKRIIKIATFCLLFSACAPTPEQQLAALPNPKANEICLRNTCVQGIVVGDAVVYRVGGVLDSPGKISAVSVYSQGCLTIDSTQSYDIHVYGLRCNDMRGGQVATLKANPDTGIFAAKCICEISTPQ